MIWTKIEQKKTYLVNRVGGNFDYELGSALWKDHLLILGDVKEFQRTEKELLCWNIRTFLFDYIFSHFE